MPAGSWAKPHRMPSSPHRSAGRISLLSGKAARNVQIFFCLLPAGFVHSQVCPVLCGLAHIFGAVEYGNLVPFVTLLPSSVERLLTLPAILKAPRSLRSLRHFPKQPVLPSSLPFPIAVHCQSGCGYQKGSCGNDYSLFHICVSTHSGTFINFSKSFQVFIPSVSREKENPPGTI